MVKMNKDIKEEAKKELSKYVAPEELFVQLQSADLRTVEEIKKEEQWLLKELYKDLKMTPEQASTFKRHMTQLKHGLQAAVPLVCFPPGARVLMADYTIKNIEDIVEGEMVRTHEGKCRRVLSTFKRSTTEYVYGFTFGNGSKAVTPMVTGEHPIYNKRVEIGRATKKHHNNIKCEVCNKQFSTTRIYTRHLKKHNDEAHLQLLRKQGREVVSLVGWVEANEVKSGSFVGIPLGHIGKGEFGYFPNSREKSEALAVALGYYLAEGSVQFEYRDKYGRLAGDTVCYTMNIDEVDYHDDIERAWNTLGFKVNKYYNSERNVCAIHVNGRKPAYLMYSLGSKYCDKKTIHHTVFDWPVVLLKKLFDSYYNGDGGKTGTKCFSTTSIQLGWQLFYIAAVLNYNPTYPVYKKGSCRGVKNPRKPYLTCCLTSSSSNKIYEDGYYWVRIKGVKTDMYSGYVYNLEVEEHDSYIVEGITVHNCNSTRCPFYSVCRAKLCGIDPPKGKPCVIEINLLQYYRRLYLESFNVEEGDFGSFVLVNELAELDMYDFRATQILAIGDYSTGDADEEKPNISQALLTNVPHYDEMGNVTHTTQEIHSAYYLKEKLKNRKLRILELLVATRKEQYKKDAALGEKVTSSFADEQRKIMMRIEQMTNEIEAKKTTTEYYETVIKEVPVET